jgi:outer membrane protein TolC
VAPAVDQLRSWVGVAKGATTTVDAVFYELMAPGGVSQRCDGGDPGQTRNRARQMANRIAPGDTTGGTHRRLPLRTGLGLLLLGLSALGPLAAPGRSQPRAAAPLLSPTPDAGILQLERSWTRLDQELRMLDEWLPGPTSPPAGVAPERSAPPAGLLRANRPPDASFDAGRLDVALPALALPTAAELREGSVQGLSLSQALAIAYGQSPELQAKRLEVASQLALLQAALGTYWPRLLAVAGLGYEQTGTSFSAALGNPVLGLGGAFAPGGAFYVPTGAQAYLNQGVRSGAAGLELGYDLVDFARTPAVQAAKARLQESRSRYANDLRQLQLSVSEAYYNLQRSDQLVRIRNADLRNDLVILQDVLALKQAGLVPRLDLLRRQAIEAEAQELLTQALADRAVARRRLGTLLNLPANLTPSASDPISLQPAWPLDLESSLLAAYKGNPELEAVLAARQALARQKDQVAAQLLPRLSFLARASGLSNQTNQWSFTGDCCGTTTIPSLNTSGYDWSVALTFRWLLFDAGSTAAEVRALANREAAQVQIYAARRNDIRLRLEQAFFNHEASLAKLASARRGVAASLEGFRDAKLRYQTGLSDETTLSLTQDRLVQSLVRRLNATIDVNITYAQLLRELLPVARDPGVPVPVILELPQALVPARPLAPAAAPLSPTVPAAKGFPTAP